MKYKSKLKVKITKEEVWNGILQMVIFITLLTVTTILAFSFHDVYFYYFHSSIQNMFMKIFLLPTDAESSYDRIYKISDWWDFMENVITTQLFDADPYKELQAFPSKPQEISFWIDNIILGMPKLRQIRVQKDSCIIHDVFNRYFNNCYATYDQSIEEKTPIFKSTPYLSYEVYPVNPIRGIISEYVGPGYVQFLSYNSTENSEIIENLKKLKWVDRGTRLVIFELIFYNLNMNVFSNVRLLSERLPTGSLLMGNRIEILPLYNIWSERRVKSIVISTIFQMTIVLSISREIWILIQVGAYSYFRNAWKWLNMAFLTCAYVTIVLSMLHLFRMQNLIDSIKLATNELFLDEACTLYYNLKMCLAICTILIWLKLFRFVSFNRTMLNFSIALRRGYHDIVGFSFMFFIVFAAFATTGLLLFCKTNPAFSTFKESLVTMLRMLMTDFQYEHLERSDKFFGPLFFVLFILFIYFVLLNTFLAVISDTYVNVHNEDFTKYSILKAYFHYIIESLRNCFKKPKIDRRSTIADTKKVDILPPRPMKKDEALNEFFGDPQKSDPDDITESGTDNDAFQKRKSIVETQKALENLTDRVKQIEADTEHFMSKMDRILQKLELMANESQSDQ